MANSEIKALREELSNSKVLILRNISPNRHPETDCQVGEESLREMVSQLNANLLQLRKELNQKEDSFQGLETEIREHVAACKGLQGSITLIEAELVSAKAQEEDLKQVIVELNDKLLKLEKDAEKKASSFRLKLANANAQGYSLRTVVRLLRHSTFSDAVSNWRRGLCDDLLVTAHEAYYS